MNKKLMLLSLAVLFSTNTLLLQSSASVGSSPIPNWIDCRGAHPHGNIVIAAAIGQSTVVVSWTSPANDWIRNGRCAPYGFTQAEMTVFVNHPSLSAVPDTVTCHSTSCSDGFTLLVLIFVGKGYITRPYQLQYGDQVVTEVVTTYAGYENHFGSYTLSVTS